jgi:uncharacterized phage-associated protein
MAQTSAHTVAAELRRRLPGLPVKKLHKLLYYCQGHHLATFGEPLFHETISAWDMGPVVGQLWYLEKKSGPADAAPESDEAVLNTIGYVASRYGQLNGLQLERLTHSETPWLEADDRRLAGESERIPTASIERYFREAALDQDDELTPVDSELLRELLDGAEQRLTDHLDTDSIDDLRRHFATHG